MWVKQKTKRKNYRHNNSVTVQRTTHTPEINTEKNSGKSSNSDSSQPQ